MVVWEKDGKFPLPFYVSQDKIKKEQVSYRQIQKDLLQFTSDMNFKATQVRISKWLRWEQASGNCFVQSPLLKQGQPEQIALDSVLWGGF